MRIYPSTPIPQNSMLIDGNSLNIKMKQLANPKVANTDVNFIDTNIEYIDRTDNPPGSNISEIVNVGSPGCIPIYMWYDFDDKTVYFKSNCKHIHLNTDSAYSFMRLSKCKEIHLRLYTSKVTNMSYMFSGCRALTSLDVSKFDTSNVKEMSYMFNSCVSLTSLDLSNFNTSKVFNFGGMFENCPSLTLLDVSNWNTSNVTHMYYMFYNCLSLTSLDLSHFDTSNATSTTSMFAYCSSLTSLDVSSFNTSKVLYMGYMFSGCTTLSSLDISNFDTSKVINMSYMFRNCTELNSIDYGNNFIINNEMLNTSISDQSTAPTYYMYNNCTANKPIGGNWDLGTWNNDGTFIKNA